ncbi:hypothetical protein [Pyrobaculum aerophilum]|uniref:PaREP2a n=1 Tax=Pyrobaculum aerophilum (strain ATCC 51768 / DSM 7523 / JCM 9630 / CIP 104966 / NBRC 100827 / IM2) TaxID=178306 RepID=Q8ZVT3_PYRAE|nr:MULTISPECIES: hypothetical protein [Pyrobaculum]AAL63973.1 paREP2a [Pyrobaculum aerophilum str. IM2]MCX8136433.1 hypothetical protein [Pyrobaculum aerophilum]
MTKAAKREFGRLLTDGLGIVEGLGVAFWWEGRQANVVFRDVEKGLL